VQPIGVTVDDLDVSLVGETARTSGKTFVREPLNSFGAAFNSARRSPLFVLSSSASMASHAHVDLVASQQIRFDTTDSLA
jgi:hypothetical protein